MMRKTIIIVLGIMILLPNVPFIRKDIHRWLDEGYFRYSNLDGSYRITTDFGFKSPGFSTFGFEYWIKETSPAKENQRLYRLYKINPLCFWRWSYYLRHSIHLDYMDPIVIEKNIEKKTDNAKIMWHRASSNIS
ncbi:hypothetical protein [uncultured Sphingobacterium sp.]|uniref:hypothetical protein n=1 Tax=uncultured Sphingobacterium sp. TaxID=182688 RepID=UPI003747BAD7